MEPHWELNDASPAPEKAKSLQRQKGVGLYQDPLSTDERTSRTTTNVDGNRRGDDFGAHYNMSDDSPGAKIPHDQRANRADMAANWGFESPLPERKIYKTAGDGMGGRAGARAWGIGDGKQRSIWTEHIISLTKATESDPEVDADVRPSARSRRQQAQAGADNVDF